MQHPSQSFFSLEDFMAFFRDHKIINQLTTDQKAEIASQLLFSNTNITKQLLQQLLEDSSGHLCQLIEEKKSLPVF